MNKMLAIVLTASIILTLPIIFFANSMLPCKASESPNENWTLTVAGAVQTPLTLNLTDLLAMPQTTEFATIYCVDLPETVIIQGNWTGVKLSLILSRASVSDSAIKVAFYASGGYSTDLTVQQAMEDNVIVAYQLNGKPLNETLRLVVPGSWGYKWISQITDINPVDYDYLGTWESQGYSDRASIALGDGRTSTSFVPIIPTPPRLSPAPPTSTEAPNSSPATPSQSPQATATQVPSPSPKPSQPTLASPTLTQSLMPSPTYTPTQKPISSRDAQPITSLYPYAIAAMVVAVTALASYALLTKKKKSEYHTRSGS